VEKEEIVLSHPMARELFQAMTYFKTHNNLENILIWIIF
jgi:hypothetical protein